MRAFTPVAKAAALFKPKARLWVEGRKDIFARLAEAIPTGAPLVWIHCASLGEFEQGRPVIEKIRAEKPEYKILLTFFSPSGYEIRRGYPGADYIFYLPMDTPSGARKFLDIVNPEVAIFIKYEFWLNYLSLLGKRGCRTYLVSAIFRRDSVFFRPYGGAFRRALATFAHLFVQDEESRGLLSGIGIENVTVTGDTRFDRVTAVAEASKKIPLIEEFARAGRVLVAGSTWKPDEDLLERLIVDNPGDRFIIAPHEIDEQRITALLTRLPEGTVRYTRAAQASDIAGARVLVIDTIGILSSVYRYGRLAYIGGGFGHGIHNILEAATFGLPIAFGPRYQKFREARDLIEMGGAASVDSYEGLRAWYADVADDGERDRRSDIVRGYVADNRGATDSVVEEIFALKG